mgnify:CR=1 FL=1
MNTEKASFSHLRLFLMKEIKKYHIELILKILEDKVQSLIKSSSNYSTEKIAENHLNEIKRGGDFIALRKELNNIGITHWNKDRKTILSQLEVKISLILSFEKGANSSKSRKMEDAIKDIMSKISDEFEKIPES